MMTCGLFRRSGLLLLLMAFPMFAQFSQLAATDDGKQLYFTSQMLFNRATETLGWPEYRLYRFGTDGVTLFAERGAFASDATFSSSTGVSNLRVTGDGSLVGFTFNEICLTGGQDCGQPLNEAELRGKQSVDLGPGTVQLSRNGRWALVTKIVYDDSTPGVLSETTESTLIDLTTGQRTAVNEIPVSLQDPNAFNTIASDGTVLAFTLSSGKVSPGLWKQGQFTPVSLPPGPAITLLAISDDASTLIGYTYSTKRGLPSQIIAINLTSGKTTVVIQTDDLLQRPVFMALSNNGQRLLYRVATGNTLNGPAYVWDAHTGTTLPVPLADGELATDGTLSGIGDFAFVATSRAQIVKFLVPAGGIPTPLFPATPYCDDPGDVAGGSLARLHCTFDIPTADLEGKVSYQSWPMPVVYSKPGDLGLQIPWQWDNFVPPLVSFDIPSPSGFRPSQEFSVWEGAPAIIPADPDQSSLFGIQIVKGDWSGLVTSQPLPGDIVSIYMTGLGPVVGDVQTGVPAPLTALRPIQWDLGCEFVSATGRAEHAELLFAGLAPGMIGVYQTTFRVPAIARSARLTDLQCTLTASNMAVSFGPGRPGYGIGSGNVSAFGKPSSRTGSSSIR